MLKYRRVRSMLKKPCRQYRTSSVLLMCQIKESCIASFSSGAPAPTAVEKDMMAAESMGKQAKEKFIKERL